MMHILQVVYGLTRPVLMSINGQDIVPVKIYLLTKYSEYLML